MSASKTLGWNPDFLGELDHRRLKAPALKLRSITQGTHGDSVYCVDLRLRRPNTGNYLSTTELHSLEHFLLEGFSRLLPQNFIAIGIMGCQTGFYLVLQNEGRAAVLQGVLAQILEDLQQATAVPYANLQQCGHYQNHSLAAAQKLAREILSQRAHWLDAA